jgi:hypothetical protein
MKNLFNLSNEERNRILTLHENSTKKQYLDVISEQTGTSLDNYKLPTGNISVNSTVPKITPSAQPTTPATLKDVQTILSSLGYDLGKAGVDGKLGPATLNALVSALKTSQKSTATPTSGETSGSTVTSGGTATNTATTSGGTATNTATTTTSGGTATNATVQGAKPQYDASNGSGMFK